jgi:hypothetical protein
VIIADDKAALSAAARRIMLGDTAEALAAFGRGDADECRELATAQADGRNMTVYNAILRYSRELDEARYRLVPRSTRL